MNAEKKQQAKNLYFQTELTKTQIATLLDVSRRSLTYWIKEGNWNRLKDSAIHMPAILAENCYHIMGHLTQHHLSEQRITNPITPKEIDALHKLTITIGKLKNRSTINESIEMFGFFMDGLKRRNPKLAAELIPYIDEYMSSRASIYPTDILPPNFTGIGGRIPWIEEDRTEQQIDTREAYYSDPDIIRAHAEAGMPLPSEEEISALPKQGPIPHTPTYTIQQRNAEILLKFQQQRKDYKATSQQENIETQTITETQVLNNTSLSFGEGRGEALHNTSLSEPVPSTVERRESRGEDPQHVDSHILKSPNPINLSSDQKSAIIEQKLSDLSRLVA